MRVLMLNYEYPPIGGGSGNATAYLLRALEGTPGLKIDLVTAGTHDEFQWEAPSPSIRIAFLPVAKEDLHYWRSSELAGWSARALRFARRLTARTSYDLCHCWSGWPAGVIGHHLRRRQPYIVALRGSDVPGYSARLRLLDSFLTPWLSRRVWRRAAAVTVLSQRLLTLARQTLPALAARVIYNGVDADRFTPAASPVEPFTLLFVGRLIRRKGLRYLIEGFSRLAAENSHCRLLIVGEGPERAATESLIERLALRERVQIAGEVSHQELPDVYRRASVFVLPSVEEALSNVVLEAMAAGLPVITSDTGAAELVRKSGTVIASPRPESIYRAARAYLDEPELRSLHGERARVVAESLTWTRAAAEYLQIYEQAIAGSCGTSARERGRIAASEP